MPDASSPDPVALVVFAVVALLCGGLAAATGWLLRDLSRRQALGEAISPARRRLARGVAAATGLVWAIPIVAVAASISGPGRAASLGGCALLALVAVPSSLALGLAVLASDVEA